MEVSNGYSSLVGAVVVLAIVVVENENVGGFSKSHTKLQKSNP